jgi:hypothetical protein
VASRKLIHEYRGLCHDLKAYAEPEYQRLMHMGSGECDYDRYKSHPALKRCLKKMTLKTNTT